MKQDDPSRYAKSADELLSCWDRQFVDRAYWTILRRAPDPSGLAQKLFDIRTGVSKVEILRGMRESPEGRDIAADVPGLDTAIQQYRTERRRPMRRLFRMLLGARRFDRQERASRALQNQMSIGVPSIEANEVSRDLTAHEGDRARQGTDAASDGMIEGRDLRRRLARIEAALARLETRSRLAPTLSSSSSRSRKR